jgi:glycosyltransferase involved in cell wall biosynthesis
MIIYIPKDIDVYNTHLKNLTKAYVDKGVEMIVGYETFIYGSILPDVIHFHMVDGLISFMKYDERLFFERLDYFKNRGAKLVYTAHDILTPWKFNEIDYPTFFSRFIDYIDVMIHHGQNSIEIHKNKFPSLQNKTHIVCPHGNYLSDMRNYNENKDTARLLLKLPKKKKIVLVFGQLQFKNTAFANKVFQILRKENKDYFFLMAGVYPLFRYNGLNIVLYKLNNRLLNKFRLRKKLVLGRVTNYETYLLFKASDVVLLPHKSGLTSGIIAMAATLGIPFVYPNIGVFEEQANYCFAEKYERENKNSACNSINKIINSGIQVFDNSKWLVFNNWENHVDKILSIL